MEITRLTSPTFPAISPHELETWLRIDADSDPQAVAMLLGSATETVEGLTGLTIRRADYRITLDCPGDKLPIHPVASITSLDGVTVILTAGYADAASIPDGLRHAIAVLVSAGYNSREEIDDKTFKTVERLCARYRRFF